VSNCFNAGCAQHLWCENYCPIQLSVGGGEIGQCWHLYSLIMAVVDHHNANISSIADGSCKPDAVFPCVFNVCPLGVVDSIGIEGAAECSEETVNVRRVAPRAIIRFHSRVQCPGFPIHHGIGGGAVDPLDIGQQRSCDINCHHKA